MDEAGAAIARWFAGLSGPALEAAIAKAFDKFDTDGTGLLDRYNKKVCPVRFGFPNRIGHTTES